MANEAALFDESKHDRMSLVKHTNGSSVDRRPSLCCGLCRMTASGGLVHADGRRQTSRRERGGAD